MRGCGTVDTWSAPSTRARGLRPATPAAATRVVGDRSAPAAVGRGDSTGRTREPARGPACEPPAFAGDARAPLASAGVILQAGGSSDYARRIEVSLGRCGTRRFPERMSDQTYREIPLIPVRHDPRYARRSNGSWRGGGTASSRLPCAGGTKVGSTSWRWILALASSSAAAIRVAVHRRLLTLSTGLGNSGTRTPGSTAIGRRSMLGGSGTPPGRMNDVCGGMVLGEKRWWRSPVRRRVEAGDRRAGWASVMLFRFTS